ncbi:MAG: TerB family tellurite resistance protein, partial [Cyanobium sp.]
ERLESVVPGGEDIGAAIAAARAHPERCRERFVEEVRSRRRKFSALEIHKIIYGLLDVASADGIVHEGEKSRLLELAGLIGVPNQACELVVNQYEKERRHED